MISRGPRFALANSLASWRVGGSSPGSVPSTPGLAWLLSTCALALAISTGCAAAPPPAVQAPPAPPASTAPVTSPPPGDDAFKPEGPLREEWMPLLKPAAADPSKVKLLAPPPGLAPVPATCAAFVSRRPDAKVACADRPSALGALASALERSDPEARDAGLLALEPCAGLPPGVARALRAELAPAECGEAILEPVLKAPPPSTDGIVYAAMLGQAVASRLARTAQGAPTLSGPHDQKHVRDFINGPMRTWMEQQALAIETISQAAAELPYYGKGIAAIEAGIAEMRLVGVVRGAPIPDEFVRDKDLENMYYGTLDQALDPRKDRGRDAALVGLRELALVGSIRDARVKRARELLSRLYGGRRIDSLDRLLVPALPTKAPSSVEERLAAQLPTFYAGLLLDEEAVTRPGTLRQLVDVGVPLPLRAAAKRLELTPEARALYARAHLELGRLYWRAVDFDQAVALAAAARAAAPSDDATLTLALGLALRGGPDDGADMMRKAPRALPPPHTAALDALVARAPTSPVAGAAAFDAAMLHQLGAPEGADVAYWGETNKRYLGAAKLLTDPVARAAATEGAHAAESIAQAILAPAVPMGGAPVPPAPKASHKEQRK